MRLSSTERRLRSKACVPAPPLHRRDDHQSHLDRCRPRRHKRAKMRKVSPRYERKIEGEEDDGIFLRGREAYSRHVKVRPRHSRSTSVAFADNSFSQADRTGLATLVVAESALSVLLALAGLAPSLSTRLRRETFPFRSFRGARVPSLRCRCLRTFSRSIPTSTLSLRSAPFPERLSPRPQAPSVIGPPSVGRAKLQRSPEKDATHASSVVVH